MECGIDEMKYPDKKFVGSYMFNSYRKHEILLLPIEILHKSVYLRYFLAV